MGEIKNLLVTGGLGFIGSNYIRYLLGDAGYRGRVVNIDKLTYAGNPENLADIEKTHDDRYKFIRADIGDYDAMVRVFDDHAIDAVCNFAAESHVDRSIVGPNEFILTNILGTYNLLEIARERAPRIQLFHHISTDEVYGSVDDSGKFSEDSPYRPNSPYSASKASSDHLARAYNRTYELPVIVSNSSNNYGPYQFPEKLIPLMILNARDGKPLPVYGDGQNIRDWIYVEDHCRALWAILQNGKSGETYNIGGGNEIENIKVVEMICKILDDELGELPVVGSRRELVTYVRDRRGHDRRYAIDSSKITQELGWVPKETFETGLLKTVDWYLSNPEWTEHIQSGEYKAWIESHYGQ